MAITLNTGAPAMLLGNIGSRISSNLHISKMAQGEVSSHAPRAQMRNALEALRNTKFGNESELNTAVRAIKTLPVKDMENHSNKATMAAMLNNIARASDKVGERARNALSDPDKSKSTLVLEERLTVARAVGKAARLQGAGEMLVLRKEGLARQAHEFKKAQDHAHYIELSNWKPDTVMTNGAWAMYRAMTNQPHCENPTLSASQPATRTSNAPLNTEAASGSNGQTAVDVPEQIESMPTVAVLSGKAPKKVRFFLPPVPTHDLPAVERNRPTKVAVPGN